MMIFGLKQGEVSTLIGAVRPDYAHTKQEIREIFARSVWSQLAEPGDTVANRVITAMSAAEALELLIAGADPTEWLMMDRDDVGLLTAIDRWKPRISSGTALIALRQAARFGVKLRVPADETWPVGLLDLGTSEPTVLWTRGEETVYESLGTSIALVGARAATGYGEHVTMEMSAGLVDRKYTVVSGAAYGIDGMAHRAALASKGKTVAVLAGGVDRFYPSGHDALLTRIVEEGVVISELPCGQAPTRWRFLLRNRLIAAMSQATVVIEAGYRSGSLNTAGHATTLGRPVGAVPGPVTSPASAGCHRLLRESDAIAVTNADEAALLAPIGEDGKAHSIPVTRAAQANAMFEEKLIPAGE